MKCEKYEKHCRLEIENQSDRRTLVSNPRIMMEDRTIPRRSIDDIIRNCKDVLKDSQQ